MQRHMIGRGISVAWCSEVTVNGPFTCTEQSALLSLSCTDHNVKSLLEDPPTKETGGLAKMWFRVSEKNMFFTFVTCQVRWGSNQFKLRAPKPWKAGNGDALSLFTEMNGSRVYADVRWWSYFTYIEGNVNGVCMSPYR